MKTQQIAVFSRFRLLLQLALLISATAMPTSALSQTDTTVFVPLLGRGSTQAGSAPVIHSFGADPAMVAPLGESVLRWEVSSATSLSLSDIGAVTGSSVSVHPAATTVYVLTASNAYGAASAQTTVTVDPQSDSEESNFFLPNSPGDAYVTTGQPRMAIDAAGGIHVIYAARAPDISGVRPAYYAYCPSACTSADKFTTVSLNLGNPLFYAQLALDPAGHPRVLINEGAPDSMVHYVYGECDANCTSAAQWTLVEVAIGKAHASIDVEQNQSFALDAQGRPRFLYYADPFGQEPSEAGTFYMACDEGCTNPANWTRSKLTDEQWAYVALAFTPGANSQPRVAISLTSYDPIFGMFAYLECDGDCAVPANWQGAVLASTEENYYNTGAVYALRINSQGQPRIAIQPWQAYASDIGLELGYLSYLTCNSNCRQPANWQAVNLGLAQMDGEGGVDLVLDNQDHPRIAYRIPHTTWEPAYAWCDSNCESSAQGWQTKQLPTTALAKAEWPFLAMQGCPSPECIPPIPACTSAFWDAGYWPSLALDPAGKPRIAFDMKHVHSGGGCEAGSFVRWSRFVSFDQP
jgi:hypothetical protein